jgi:hypothetical protein
VAGTWQLKTPTQDLLSNEITTFEPVGSTGRGRCKTLGSIQHNPSGNVCQFYFEGTYLLIQDSLFLQYGPCRTSRSPSNEWSKNLQAGVDAYNQTHQEFLVLSKSEEALVLLDRENQKKVKLSRY